jgi:uncharacterized repeat protein (TIGR02543 family)
MKPARKFLAVVLIVAMAFTTVFTIHADVVGDPDPPQFTIRLNLTGGTAVHEERMTEPDGTLEALPYPPTREGFVFVGWFTAASGGAEVTTDMVFTADATLYARWTAIEPPPEPPIQEVPLPEPPQWEEYVPYVPYVPQPAPTPTPQPTPEPEPEPTIEIYTYEGWLHVLMAELLGDISPEYFSLVVGARPTYYAEEGFVIIDVEAKINDELVEDFPVPLIVAVPVEISEELNPHRIVAVDENNQLSGEYDPETGLFIFAVNASGSFTVRYMEDLLRLRISAGSYEITDSAGNAETIRMDVAPFIYYDTNDEPHLMVSLRFLAEALGLGVNWEESTDGIAVLLTDGNQTLRFQEGNQAVFLNGVEHENLNMPPSLLNNRLHVSTSRAILHVTQNIENAEESPADDESRIRDTDMALAMMAFTQNNILTQAATVMLAQSNQAPQSILHLLG